MDLPVLHEVKHHVRVASTIAPGRPAVWLGLRVALATAIPLALAPLLPPVAGSWAPLAGFMVALADKGGAYRIRARTLTGVAIGALFAAVLGSAIAGHGLITAIPIAVGLGLCAFGHAWGPPAISIGNTAGIQLLVAASQPCSTPEIWQRAEGIIVGSSIALALALVVWPVRVYKPGRRAISAMFHILAEHARAVATRQPREQLFRDHRAIREAIEVARVTLAATRRGRAAESGRGERLLALVQLGDQQLGLLVGLEEVLDSSPEPVAWAVRALGELAGALDELATAVLDEERVVVTKIELGDVPDLPNEPVAAAVAAQARLLLARSFEDFMLARDLMMSLADESDPQLELPRTELDKPPSIGERIREAIAPDAFAWRHALRVGIVVAIAMTIARELDLSHRYWVTLTAFIMMQPYGAATRVRVLQRVGGTILGAVLAAAIPYFVDDPLVMVGIVIVLAGTSASVLQLNYGLYSTFLTPTFVLLAEVHTHDPHLVGVRILNTLIGATLAFVATYVVRHRESARFDDAIARAYEVAAKYLDEVTHVLVAGVPLPSRAIIARRRAYGVALNGADLALDKVAAERVASEVLEPRMSQVVFLRRLGAAINALGSTRAVVDSKAHTVELAAFGASASAVLKSLAESLHTRVPVAPRPRIDRPVSEPVLAARIARLDRVLDALTDAVTRSL